MDKEQIEAVLDRLRLHPTWRDSHGELNDAPHQAIDVINHLVNQNKELYTETETMQQMDEMVKDQVPTNCDQLAYAPADLLGKDETLVLANEFIAAHYQDLGLKGPICSADGCSRREPCGPYCRDSGNFDKPKPEVDPLVEAMTQACQKQGLGIKYTPGQLVAHFRTALAARGLEVRKVGEA